MSVRVEAHSITCEIESTQGYSLCHRCGQKATEFHGYDQALEVRHLPLSGRSVVLGLRPKRYRCRYCEGVVTTTERPDWHASKSVSTVTM